MSAGEPRNRLGEETSPYLLQHATNPVGWFPWGEEALAESKKTDKPILLSVGYSACHWCHVMEHESFESDEIAALMNEHFVPIKVDREERPDIDEIYMNAVQMMTGSGGWPLTVFLTPELKPFYGGTYFPPEDKWGRPGFKTVLLEIHRVYSKERTRIEEASAAVTQQLQSLAQTKSSDEMLSRSSIARAAAELAGRFDTAEGGFSPAPKFPPSASLALLSRHYLDSRDPSALEMVELTLDKMAAGGLFDQLGGGFHRYSTDAQWLVPHFEKMLYDNALLVPVYLEAFQITKNDGYARVARETLSWVVREMQSDEGGYFSSQDADSEGVEGKFYVWSKDDVDGVLGDDAARFSAAYGVSADGNWEGSNVLNLPGGLSTWTSELDDARARLTDAREKRIRPGLDDKVLTSWNGMMIVAMAKGYRVLGENRWLESATRAARFIETTLIDEGRLLATYRDGRAKLKAYLDDHAFLLAGFVELYKCDFDPHWLEAATRIARAMETLFKDGSTGGFYFTGEDHEALIMRSKTGYDGATPSGNGLAATYLLELAALTGSAEMESVAVETIRAFHKQIERSPSAFAQMLIGLDLYLADRRELAVVGTRDAPAVTDALSRLWSLYAPHVAIVVADPANDDANNATPLVQGKTPGADPAQPRFYLCERYQCQAPTDSLSDVIGALDRRVLE